VITMYDSIQVSEIPSDAQAVAGYVDGDWQTVGELQASFPRALLLSITVTGNDAGAMAVDEEPGDASVAGAVAWLRGAVARGVWRPCAYASVSGMGALLSACTAAGLELSGLRFWSAHYGAGEHICGPSSCGLVSREMDGTQWIDSALGRNLDQSLLADSFFPWYDVLMTDIPTVQSGSTGQAVKNWQGLLGAHGHAVTIDGSFGPGTETATKAYQSSADLAADGVAGPDTWTAALSG
jgi:hypothetical protein